VDDGKSTLIGRLLFDAKQLFDDHLQTLEADSRRIGTQNGSLDFALLLDGLGAEREQGITIDVAYRFFATERRTFIVADTPGHEQYTRNMVTGASTADCAVILVDARKGVLTQTRRHSYVLSLLGIRHVAVAVTKMDLVGYAEESFREIETAYGELARGLGLTDVVFIPVSGLHGDNVVDRTPEMPWYEGPTLLEYLERVEVDQERMQRAPFRLPVQLVIRPDPTFRGFAGTIAGGVVRPGDPVRVYPSGRESTVARIVTFDGDLDEAVTGQAVTLTLADEIDVSRGDVLGAAAAPPEVADQFEATIVWMADEPMLRGRTYLMRLATRQATATIAPLKYKVNLETLERVPGTQLGLNEIGVCALELDRQVAFDPYAANRDTGGFVLIDRLTYATVGAGMLHFALRRSQNVRWQAVDVDKAARAEAKGQRAAVVWLTGLSGAGKSTVSNLVEQRLHALGKHTYLLDGDNVRHGLNKDLGFTDADRVENIRRVAEVARLMADAGLIVIVSFISPFRSERMMARSLVEEGEFLEVFVDAPLALAEQRDPKGLYEKARRGELKNFTGIDSPYEPPDRPEVHLDTAILTPDEAAEHVIDALRDRGLLG
jgi:bifunctional enzyme CysN/CysC